MIGQKRFSIPNLEAAQREARMLLRNLRKKNVVPAERYRQHDATDVFPVRLPDAQYLVARYYGFKSWVALTAFLTPHTTGNNQYLKAGAPKKREEHKQSRREAFENYPKSNS
jgi:hypothetical protein